MFICTLETFQTWIIHDMTANEVIRWWSMYSCIAWTDCICDQELDWLHQVKYLSLSQVLNLSRLDLNQNS